MIRKMDRRTTPLSKRCSLVCSMFFVFHSQTFVSSYCFRQLISGPFVIFWSQDCQIRPQCSLLTITFHRCFGCSQTNPDKITHKGACHLLRLLNSRDYTLLCHCRWFYTRQRPNQRGTLELWLRHDSISHIDWRQVVGY